MVDVVDIVHQEIDGYTPTVGTRMKKVIKKLVNEDWYYAKPIFYGPDRCQHVFFRNPKK